MPKETQKEKALRPWGIDVSYSPHWVRKYNSPQMAGCGTLARAINVERSRVHLFYSGHVQGVGFRYAVRQVATGFEVTGTVCNLSDGRVEMIAEGEKNELEAFCQAIRDSGLGHFIRKEQATWGAGSNAFRGFQIAG